MKTTLTQNSTKEERKEFHKNDYSKNFKIKRVDYWRCLKCEKTYDSKNALNVPIKKEMFKLSVGCFACPFCKNPQSKGFYNKHRGAEWIKTEQQTLKRIMPKAISKENTELKTTDDIYKFIEDVLWASNYINTQKGKLKEYRKALIKIQNDYLKEFHKKKGGLK